MKLAITSVILLVFIVGCSIVQESPPVLIIKITNTISGIQDLLLNEQDLLQLGMTNDLNAQDLQQLGLSEGTNCQTEEGYSNIVDSSLGQYSICIYNNEP